MEILNNGIGGAVPGDWLISPTRGEVGSGAAFAVTAETAADIPARDALLDRAMGPRWRRKSSEKLRKGRIPSEGLAFVAKNEGGAVVGTVRLWDVALGSPLGGKMPGEPTEAGAVPPRSIRALLLGPLAVDPALKNSGIGSALIRHAIGAARQLGHGAILLVGDEPYYGRFGFSAARTGGLAMPGPYEKHRLLALELVPGALDGAKGVLRAAGRKQQAVRRTAAA